MALIWVSSPSHFLTHSNRHSLRFPSLILTSSSSSSRFLALRATTGTEGTHDDSALLRRPLISSSPPSLPIEEEEERVGEGEGRKKKKKRMGPTKADEEWVDWEDQILEDTVPLVGFVRMILHSGKYDSGDRLIPEHEKAILERLLPYHPEFEKKIGCGIDYITIGFHPEFDNSRCLFIVRKDGKLVDFSYWKCIKGLIKKKYPIYADSFILRHSRRRRQTE